MVKFISALISFLSIFPVSIFSQVIISGNDVPVSTISNGVSNPSIAVKPGGGFAVLWQQIGKPGVYRSVAPDLSFQSVPVDLRDNLVGNPFFSASGNLCYLNYRQTFSYIPGGSGTESTYRYSRINGQSEDTLGNIITYTYRWSYYVEPDYSYATMVSREHALFGGKIVLGYDLHCDAEGMAVRNLESEHGLLSIHPETGSIDTLHSAKYRFGWQQEEPENVRQHAYFKLSPPYNSRLGLYESKVPVETGPGQYRYETRYSTIDNSFNLSAPVLLDSSSIGESDRFEAFLLTEHRVIILYRTEQTRALMCDIYNIDGSVVERGKSLGIDIAPRSGSVASWSDTPGKPDFLATLLPDGSPLILWLQLDEFYQVNILAQAFDEDMNPRSTPKRINSDATGMEDAPAVAWKSDTLLIAWARQYPDGRSQIFIKAATVSEITSLHRPVTAASGLSISGLYPQPASVSLELELSGTSNSQQHLTYRIHNALGQTVLRGTYASGNTLSLPVHSIPAGVYLLVLDDGNSSISKPFSIVR